VGENASGDEAYPTAIQKSWSQ